MRGWPKRKLWCCGCHRIMVFIKCSRCRRYKCEECQGVGVVLQVVSRGPR